MEREGGKGVERGIGQKRLGEVILNYDTMYKPTDKDLKQLWFVECFYTFVWVKYKNWKHESYPIAYNFRWEFVICYDNELERVVNRIQVYPTSKKKLKDFISLFNS